jgi:hypothetical protein
MWTKEHVQEETKKASGQHCGDELIPSLALIDVNILQANRGYNNAAKIDQPVSLIRHRASQRLI